MIYGLSCEELSIRMVFFRTMRSHAQNLLQFVIRCWLLCLLALPALAADLKSTVILDSFTYTAGELFDVYQAHLGRNVDEETATTIAAALRGKYLDDGFARPGYTILDRGLNNGIVRIRITEARISRVEVDGDAGPYRELLEQMFGELSTGESLRPADFRDSIKYARRLRGLEIEFETVADSDNSGMFVIHIQSTYKPTEANIKLSNRGTREIGRNLVSGVFAINGIFHADSSAGIYLASARHSRDYHSAGAFLNSAVGSNGASLQLQTSSASVQVVSSGTPIQQSRDRHLIKMTKLLAFTSGNDATIWAGLDLDDLKVWQGGILSRTDRLRSIQTGISTKWRSGSSANFFSFEMESGIDGLGSRVEDFINPEDARENNYFISTLQYTRSSELVEFWLFRWDIYAQHSPHNLPSIKRFKVGGNRIGRGFDAAAVSGDRGVGNKLQLQRKLGDGSSFAIPTNAYAFYDQGSVWRNDASGRASAASAGLGMTIRGKRLSAILEVARPLTHDDADGQRNFGLFVEISATF